MEHAELKGKVLRPLADRVVVTRIEVEECTAGGIVIPDTAKEKPIRGKVIAVGPGRQDEKGNRFPVEITIGDEILFAKYAGIEVKHDGVEYQVLQEKDILAVI